MGSQPTGWAVQASGWPGDAASSRQTLVSVVCIVQITQSVTEMLQQYDIDLFLCYVYHAKQRISTIADRCSQLK